MATPDDVREIALALPAVTEERGRFAFNVQNGGKAKGIVWVWLERVHPKKARVPNLSAIGVRVRDQADKAALLAADPDVFFTEPHYNGYPAVLVRLAMVSRPQLAVLIHEAWRCQAPKKLVQTAGGPTGASVRPTVSRAGRTGGSGNRAGRPPRRARRRPR